MQPDSDLTNRWSDGNPYAVMSRDALQRDEVVDSVAVVAAAALEVILATTSLASRCDYDQLKAIGRGYSCASHDASGDNGDSTPVIGGNAEIFCSVEP